MDSRMILVAVVLAVALMAMTGITADSGTDQPPEPCWVWGECPQPGPAPCWAFGECPQYEGSDRR
jgi:hypothetical protein